MAYETRGPADAPPARLLPLPVGDVVAELGLHKAHFAAAATSFENPDFVANTVAAWTHNEYYASGPLLAAAPGWAKARRGPLA